MILKINSARDIGAPSMTEVCILLTAIFAFVTCVLLSNGNPELVFPKVHTLAHNLAIM